jgi:hypothetical protein
VKCVYSLFTDLLETFLILRSNERDMIKKCMLVFMSSTRYSCQILMEIEFSGQILGKYSNSKFHGDQCSGSRVVPYGRTDSRQQTDMTKLIVACRNFANAPIRTVSF